MTRRVAVLLAFIAFAFLIASLTVFKMSNNDIWIHLKTGENVVKTWSVPQKDPYSFTASDHDYVAHEWLSGVLFYLVYAAAGVNGLIFFKSSIIFATCAALYGACRALKVPLTLFFPCATLMLFIGSARYLERPHIFSYLFTAIYLLCYFAWREGGRRRAWILAIPALHVVWANLHGGHLQGILLLVMLAAAEVVVYVRARSLGLAAADASGLRDMITIVLLPFACLVTTFVNPYGLRLLTFPFELTGQEIFMKTIYEWQSALFSSYNNSSMFLYYIIWIITLFGSFLAVRGHSELKGTARDAAWTVNVLLAALWVGFAYEFASVYNTPVNRLPTLVERHAPFWYVVVGLFLLGNLHRLEFAHAGIVALFFALSMRHNRAVTDASVATMPTLAHNLGAILSRRRARIARPKAIPLAEPAVLVCAAVGMIALGSYTFTSSYYFGFNPPSKREMGLGIADNMPVGAVDYIARNKITGRCFPSYNAAAMLIHRMWPEVKVAMDSRNDVYGEALYKEYSRALAGGDALGAYIRKWQIDFFLITYGADRDPSFFRYLDSSPDWALVYFDDRSVVYVRNLPRFQEVIRRDAYHLISPAVAGTVEVKPEDAPRWLEEADRAVAAAPGSWSPIQYRSKALIALNRLDEAEIATRQIIALVPDAYFAWADLGFIALLRNQPDRAAEAFTQCLAIRPGYPPCRDYLTRLQAPR